VDIVVAIIGAIVTLVGIVLTAILTLRSYRQQKHIDRKEYAAQKDTDRRIEMRNLRMKGYERYLTAYRADTSLYDFGHEPTLDSPVKKKAVNEYWLAYSNLFQLASDPVLLAVAEFHKLAWMWDTELKDEAFNQEFKHLYAQMIILMRQDAFEGTGLTHDDVEKRLPFAFPKKQTVEELEATWQPPASWQPPQSPPEDSQVRQQ
jgi:hypothetical protein